jgi:DMSO/TMAO reductase YedYZ molybdopterin-dependent catalytic subunit
VTRPRFPSPLHDERNAAILGIALGVSFATCFVTGLYSHLAQHPPAWFQLPSRPAGLYRFTQGLHVASGLAAIPLLLAKLWVVYPRLFAWPPFAGIAGLVERACLLPLVGGGLFMLFTGLANINLWYPWPFNFPRAHYWAAWITIGALVVHLGAKWSATRTALQRDVAEPSTTRAPTVARREFLGTVFGVSGLVTLVTIGQTVGPLRRLALLAPRRPDVGPQGFPVNRTARAAGVLESARDAGYALVVDGRVARPLQLSREDLARLPQHSATLPIACVEGWSASRTWSGVRVRDLLEMAGAAPGARARVESLQRRRAYRTSDLDHWQAHDPDTLLATHVDGEELHVDHGFPVRLVAPNRPGVMQTKWVARLVVR